MGQERNKAVFCLGSKNFLGQRGGTSLDLISFSQSNKASLYHCWIHVIAYLLNFKRVFHSNRQCSWTSKTWEATTKVTINGLEKFPNDNMA